MDFTHYFERVASDLKAGNATEYTHRPALRNLILTDYLEFRLYRDGELVQTAKLAQLQTGGAINKIATGAANTAALIESFLNSDQPSSTTPRDLAQRMARMAQVIRGLIANAFALENDTATELHNQFDAFKQVLLGDDLTPPEVCRHVCANHLLRPVCGAQQQVRCRRSFLLY